MKKCPTCQATFGDEKRFCQVDGTPLVEVSETIAPPEDPFKTMVATPPPTTSPSISEDPMKTTVISADDKDNDILQIPEVFDPMKTVVVSEPMKFDEPSSPPSEPVVPAPEPPKFNEPSLTPPVFSDLSANEPPKMKEPSPFSIPVNEPPKVEESPIPNPFTPPPTMVETPKFEATPPVIESTPPMDSPFDKPFTPSVPSPFDQPIATPPTFNEPQPMKMEEPFKADEPKPFGSSPFDPPAPTFGQPANDPFNQPSNDPFNQPIQGDAGGWNPLSPPTSGWGDAPIVGQDMSGIPPTPVGASVGGQDKTLAFVSLGTGIASLLLIITTIIPFLGIVCLLISVGLALGAIITGILAKMRSSKNPDQYGGGGFAIGGIISGLLTLLVYGGLIAVFLIWGLANIR